jgi:hypothetical protein
VSAGNGSGPSFAADIRPLFRADDREAMEFAFDLFSFEDVRDNAAGILERLEDGSMPCDDTWPDEQIELFRTWIDAGLAP